MAEKTTAEILEMLEKQGRVPLAEQTVRSDFGPLQMAVPVDESVLDQLQRVIAENLGGDRSDYRRAEKLLTASEYLPAVGDVADAVAVSEAAEKGDFLGAGIAGLAFLPVVGNVLKRGGEEMRDQARQVLYHGTTKDFGDFKRMPFRRSTKYGRGNYLTTDPDMANIAAMDMTKLQPEELRKTYQPPVVEGARVIPVTIGDLKLAGPKDYNLALAQAQKRVGLEGLGTRSRSDKVKEVADDILEFEKGFEGKKLGRGKGTEIVVYDPKNIRSVFNAGEESTMMKPVLEQAIKKLAALRSKADKQTKELIEESMKPATRKRLEGERTETIRKIKDLKKDIEDNLPPGAPRPPGMAMGGAVLSRGLSGLIQNYSTGPLARISVPRETVPSFARGGGIPLSEQTQEMQLPPTLSEKVLRGLDRSNYAERVKVFDDPDSPYYTLEGFERSPNINRGIFRGRMPEELKELLKARGQLTLEGKRFLDAKTEEGESLESTLAAIEMLREFDENPDLPVSDLLIRKSPPRPPSDSESRNFDSLMARGDAMMEKAERREDFRAYLDQLEAEKEEVPGYFRGGAPGMRDVGFRGPQRIPDINVDQSAISAALANLPAAPAAQTNVAIQSPAERLATTTVPTRTAVTPVGQALKGQRPTDFLGYATTEGVAELGTAPGQTPFEPGMLYEGTDVLQSPTGPTAEEIAAQQAAEEAAAQAAAEEAARIEAERLAAEEAARIAAAQEAQRIEQERLAAEQLAAEQAAAEQLAAEQAAAEQLAAEQLAAQQAAEAAAREELLAQQEAQRIAQEQFDAQVAAEQAAAQQTAAEVLAQEQAAAQATQTQTQETRVESASDKIDEANQKQVVADVANQNLAQATNQGADSATIETLTLDATLKQQDADAAALEAELAVAPDPTPIYEAPTQGELLQAAADADTGPLFTTPTDLGTVIPRSTLGLVPQQTGIMSFLGQPNFDVSDSITDYTSGYPSSQDMQFRRTFYPFQQVTDEEAQNQYMAEIFKPVADMSQFRPALTFGERQQTREKGSASGSFVDVGPFGEQYKNYIPENANTGAAASAPGQYGLDSNQMYQCPEGYTLAFVNGRATCKSTSRKIARPDVDPEIIELGGRG